MKHFLILKDRKRSFLTQKKQQISCRKLKKKKKKKKKKMSF